MLKLSTLLMGLTLAGTMAADASSPVAAALNLEMQGADGLPRTIPLLEYRQPAAGGGVAKQEKELQVDGMTWKAATAWTPVAGRPGCYDGETTVTLVAGATDRAVVSWTWKAEKSGWSADTYVFVPAMVYNGNRFEHVEVPYSPFWPGAWHYGVSKAPSVSLQPGLRNDGRAELLEVSSADAATPCIGFRSPSGQGFLVLTPLQNEMGLYKYSVAEAEKGRQAQLSVSAPCVRYRSLGHMGYLKGDRPRAWKAGDRVTLRTRVWQFEAPAIQTLHDRFCEARKDFGTMEKPNVLPFSEAFRLLSGKIDARNWDEAFGFYRHGMDRNSANLVDFWQLGWVSGGITTLPMLLEGTPAMREHAMRNLDFMFTQSPAANGLWRAHHDGKIMRPDDPRPPRPGYQVSVRRLGDALFYGLRQIEVLKERNLPVPPAWESSIRNLADALIRVWDKNGQLGQFLDIRSGDILIGGTSAGAQVPAGLLLAADHFKEPRYRDKAEAIARQLAGSAFKFGYTNGGPCDALAAPDSESAYALFVSLSMLDAATGKEEWRKATRDMLRQLATWITSYDFPFSATSDCGKAGAKSGGTVWANIQNKHAAPGFCTASGDALFRYWRSSQDPLALDLLRDVTHAQPQFVSRPGHPVGTLDSGMMCERVNLSGWEGPETVGGNINFSAIWVETAMMLTACEIPGIHVRTDTGDIVVFDHVEAAWRDPAAKPRILEIRNPTEFDAVVTVLAETKAELAKPLPQECLRNARRVTVPAHGKTEVEF